MRRESQKNFEAVDILNGVTYDNPDVSSYIIWQAAPKRMINCFRPLPADLPIREREGEAFS